MQHLFTDFFSNLGCCLEGDVCGNHDEDVEVIKKLQYHPTIREHPIDMYEKGEVDEIIGETYCVILNATGGLKVGLGIKMVPALSCLKVEIVRDDSAASEWNGLHPDRPIAKGDHILQVNDKHGDMRLMILEFSAADAFRLIVGKPR